MAKDPKRLHLVMQGDGVTGVWKSVEEMSDAEVIECLVKAYDYAVRLDVSLIPDEELMKAASAIAYRIATQEVPT